MVLNIENEMIPAKQPSIGDRVECSGHFGTIKYVGQVRGYSDEWAGIDWDDPERGKHDGVANGIRYFTASCDRSGSFVRLEKINFGQTAINAITSRYGQRSDDATDKYMKQQLLSIQQTINAPFIQLVGFDKIADIQSNFDSLQVVNIRLQNVSSIGKPNELRQLCPNIVELDISKNLLKDWDLIFNICTQLQNLQWLNVSENYLECSDSYNDYTFSNMKFLICGNMRLDWESILKLAKVFPGLEELRIPQNNITSIEIPENQFMHLKLLDLEANPIYHWSEILKLARITTLEQLNLENTGINIIRFDSCNIFRNLRKLVITGNLIEDWESVGELDELPNLEDLRFLKNPIFETESYATCIQLIIARISNLKFINGATIRPDERKGAEYDYLKKHGLEWLSIRDDLAQRTAFLELHNRYEELIQKYGTPEKSELVVQTKLIKESLLEIMFVFGEHVKVKKLPPSILVQKVIMLAQKMFNLNSRPVLTYISGTRSQIEINLTDEGKELGFYSVQTGDKIVVKI